MSHRHRDSGLVHKSGFCEVSAQRAKSARSFLPRQEAAGLLPGQPDLRRFCITYIFIYPLCKDFTGLKRRAKRSKSQIQ